MPSSPMKYAVASTINRAAAVSSSLRLDRAMKRRKGTSKYLPLIITAPMAAKMVNVCNHPGRVEIREPPKSAVFDARRGSRARTGITATSCVRSTARAASPAGERVRPFSFIICKTKAVEDMEIARPMDADVATSKPMRTNRRPMMNVVKVYWNKPALRINFCRRRILAGSSSRPMRKSMSTMPNSAKCMSTCPSWPMRPRP